jgi:hypothetical protein
MAYTLQHTAEAIDHKLSLIDENKNLIEYPYRTNLSDHSLPAGFEDVGDGSILVSGSYTETRFLLTTCLFPCGQKYTASIGITDIEEKPVISAGVALEIVIEGKAPIFAYATENGYSQFDLSEIVGDVAVSAQIYLNVPAGLSAGLLIKPQVEVQNPKDPKPTTWVPYMKTIGSYVDERFNSTTAKLKVLTKQLENASNIEFITWEAND